jgi:hypothetical protein
MDTTHRKAPGTQPLDATSTPLVVAHLPMRPVAGLNIAGRIKTPAIPNFRHQPEPQNLHRCPWQRRASDTGALAKSPSTWRHTTVAADSTRPMPRPSGELAKCSARLAVSCVRLVAAALPDQLSALGRPVFLCGAQPGSAQPSRC